MKTILTFFIAVFTNKRNVVSPFISCLPILFSLRMLFDSLPSKILPFPFCLYFYAHTHIKRRTHKLFIRIFFYQRLTKNFSWSFHRLEQWSASYKKIWKINNGHINTQLPGQTFFNYTRYDKRKVFPSIRKTSIKCL